MQEILKKELLLLSRKSIESKFKGPLVDHLLEQYPILSEKRGAFVTLKKHGQLRGCIGYIIPYKSLYETIIDMAQAAAFRDPRFRPVSLEELKEIDIEISILSEMIKIEDTSEIEIGRDGLMIEHPHGSGVLLPQVAEEYHWDLETYLRQICIKAGLSHQAWKDKDTVLYRFSAEVFGEKETE